MKHMADILRCARERQGLGLRELSRISGICASHLSRIERGVLYNPTYTTMLAIAIAYKVDPALWFKSPNGA